MYITGFQFSLDFFLKKGVKYLIKSIVIPPIRPLVLDPRSINHVFLIYSVPI